jgi:hypothetical protein
MPQLTSIKGNQRTHARNVACHEKPVVLPVEIISSRTAGPGLLNVFIHPNLTSLREETRGIQSLKNCQLRAEPGQQAPYHHHGFMLRAPVKLFACTGKPTRLRKYVRAIASTRRLQVVAPTVMAQFARTAARVVSIPPMPTLETGTFAARANAFITKALRQASAYRISQTACSSGKRYL